MREPLRYGPRTVFLPLPVPLDVADALRAAGHVVVAGSVPAFEDADALVLGEPSMSAFFYLGAAIGRRRPRLVLVLAGAPDEHPLAPHATATARSLPELVDLVGRWDPVALTFDPPAPSAT